MAVKILAIQKHGAGTRTIEGTQYMQESAFAGSRRSDDGHEIVGADLQIHAVEDGRLRQGLSRLGEMVRRLSNEILGAARQVPQHSIDNLLGKKRASDLTILERRNLQRFTNMHSQAFWKHTWDLLANAYRSCERDCFDDGVAIGELSGAGYCAASVGAEGLDSIGFMRQAPLPLCQTERFVGCQKGYGNAVDNYPGCRPYTEGTYDSIFREYVSQDCHME